MANQDLPALRIGVIGTGVIGSSIIALVESRQLANSILVMDASRHNAEVTAGRFAAVAIVEEIDGLRYCDVVFVCTPVSYIAETVAKLADLLPASSIVIDVGSCKSQIIADVVARRPDYGNFVPGHPIGGSHLSGPEHGQAETLAGRPFILTPYDKTRDAAQKRARDLVTSMGLEVVVRDASEHDRVLALSSHLPHIIAFAMVDHFETYGLESSDEVLVAGSFRRMTVFAKSNPRMWRDIFLDNREHILRALDGFSDSLDQYRQLVIDADGERLETLITSGVAIRDKLD